MTSEESAPKNVLSNLLISHGEDESLNHFLSYLFKKPPSSIFNLEDKDRTEKIGSNLVKSHYHIKYRKEEFLSCTFVKEINNDEEVEEEKKEEEKKKYNLYLYLKMFCQPDEFDIAPLKKITNNENFDVDTALILLFVNSHEEEEVFGDFDIENLLIVNLQKKKITRRKLLRNFLKFISLKDEEKAAEQANEEESEPIPASEEDEAQIEESITPPSVTEVEEKEIESRNQENDEMMKKLQEELERLKEENEQLSDKAEKHEDDALSLKKKLRKLKRKKSDYKCNSLKFENEFDELRKQKRQDDEVFRKIESEKEILESLRKTDEEKFRKELDDLRMHLKEKEVVVEELSQQKNELLTKLDNTSKSKSEGDEDSKTPTTKGKKGKKMKKGVKKGVVLSSKKRNSLPGQSASSMLLRKSQTLRPGTAQAAFRIEKQRSYKKRYANRRLFDKSSDRLTRRTNPKGRANDDFSLNSKAAYKGVSPRTVANQQKIQYLKNRKKQKSLQSYKIDNEKLSLRIKEIQQELSLKEKSITLLKLQLKNEKRMKKNSEIQIRKLKNLLLKKNETIAYLRLKISKL